MKLKHKFKATEVKTLVMPLIIIIVMLIIVETALIDSIKGYYYGHIKEDSISFAKNYSHSLAKVTEAQEIMNKLIEEKLLVASKTVTLYEGKYSNELLEDMAINLKVDVIYYFNTNGEIVYSNDEKYLGWKAYEGHPVYDFMVGNNISFIEKIRKDSEYDILYKYSYYRATNGDFVQIGVLAENIQNFLDSFEIQWLLDELKITEAAHQICFIDNDFNIIGSTNKQLIGTRLEKQEIKEAILTNNEYSVVGNLNGENVYDIYVPVFFNDNIIGTIHIAQPLKSTEELIKRINIVGVISLLIIFLALSYLILSINNKNKQLIKLVFYDTLTNLPNMEYFNEYLTNRFKKSKNKKSILLVNCINFRTINLVSGYQNGDKILQEIAYKLKKAVRPYKLFRFNADRFVIYVENYVGKDHLANLSYKISEEFKEPLIDNKFIDIQIGIAEIDNKHAGVDEILKDASIALSHVKSNGINYAFFNEEMKKKLERENLIEGELRIALSDRETENIYLEFQPQVDLKSNQIIGFEALARMKIEGLGNVSPIEFIDIAERKHLIVPLGNLILNKACKFVQELNKQGYSDIKVAVNVSGIQLLRDDFTPSVVNIIKKNGIKESNIELEITESILVDNYDIINEKLKSLRELEMKIALDDFGTGYSTFSRLKELNIDLVKIDRYFINKITSKNYNELITGDIISMSHKIGLAVIAEGVENEAQREYLIENHCDIMQGYLFSKPLAEEAALKILQNPIKKFGVVDGDR